MAPVDAASRFAVVTFLGSDTAHKDDRCYVTCRMLRYQLLHANKTRIRDEARDMIDWTVAVTSGVDAWKREQLERRREGRGIGACAAELVQQDGGLKLGRPVHEAESLLLWTVPTGTRPSLASREDLVRRRHHFPHICVPRPSPLPRSPSPRHSPLLIPIPRLPGSVGISDANEIRRCPGVLGRKRRYPWYSPSLAVRGRRV